MSSSEPYVEISSVNPTYRDIESNIPVYDTFTLNDEDSDTDRMEQFALLESYQNNRHNLAHNEQQPTANRSTLTERFVFSLVSFVYLPQALVSCIVLQQHSGYEHSKHMCDEAHQKIWFDWILINTISLLGTTIGFLLLYNYDSFLTRHYYIKHVIARIKITLETLYILCFLVGNIILFYPQVFHLSHCEHPEASILYNLFRFCVLYVWFQMLSPVFFGCLLLPISCCFLPCLIHAFVRYLESRSTTRAATENDLAMLPIINITEAYLREYDEKSSFTISTGTKESDSLSNEAVFETSVSSIVDVEIGNTDSSVGPKPMPSIVCAICLCNMAVGDEARVMPCHHLFHKSVSWTRNKLFLLLFSTICFVLVLNIVLG